MFWHHIRCSSSPGKVRRCPATGIPLATRRAPRPCGRPRSDWACWATAASSSCPPGCGGHGTPHRRHPRTQEEQSSSSALCVTPRAHAPRQVSHTPAAASSESGRTSMKNMSCSRHSLIFTSFLPSKEASRSARCRWLPVPSDFPVSLNKQPLKSGSAVDVWAWLDLPSRARNRINVWS